MFEKVRHAPLQPLPVQAETRIHHESDELENPYEAEIFEVVERRAQEHLKKHHRRLTIGRRIATAALALHATIVAPYLSDVMANEVAASGLKPDLTTIIEAKDPTKSTTESYFINGFNTYSADNFVKKLGPGYQEAYDTYQHSNDTLISVGYNNALLNPKQLGHQIVEKINTDKTEKVKLVFHSIGPTAGMEIVFMIMEQTDAAITDITFVHSPASYETLTDATKNELSTAKNLSGIPFIESSTPGRLLLEGAFYTEAMQKNPIKTSDGIMTRYNNGDMTTTAFVASQINALMDLDVSKDIVRLAEYRYTNHMPNISYVMIENNNDRVVDNARSVDAICGAALSIHLTCTVATVDAAHGDYFLPNAVKEYNRAFAEIAKTTAPYTVAETARHALNLYGMMQTDTPVPESDRNIPR